jgi:hypothetical protein
MTVDFLAVRIFRMPYAVLHMPYCTRYAQYGIHNTAYGKFEGQEIHCMRLLASSVLSKASYLETWTKSITSINEFWTEVNNFFSVSVIG